MSLRCRIGLHRWDDRITWDWQTWTCLRCGEVRRVPWPDPLAMPAEDYDERVRCEGCGVGFHSSHARRLNLRGVPGTVCSWDCAEKVRQTPAQRP